MPRPVRPERPRRSNSSREEEQTTHQRKRVAADLLTGRIAAAIRGREGHNELCRRRHSRTDSCYPQCLENEARTIKITAEIMTDTDLAGIDSHGISMLTWYEGKVLAGPF